MKTPDLGHHRRIGFIRAAQPIGDGLFLCEYQDGRTGKGKVWRQVILAPNPEAGLIHHPGETYSWVEPDWVLVGKVKPAGASYRKALGQWAGTLRRYTDSKQHFYVEGFFDTELRAVQFLVMNAPAFMKD